MTVSVVVPLSPDGAERDRNWAWLKAHHQRHHPGWELVEHPDPGADGWSKGRATNAAVAAATGEVLVVTDADILIDHQVLDDAVGLVAGARAAWVVPHGTVYRLTEARTVELIEGRLPPEPHDRFRRRRELDRRTYQGPAGGGIVVLTRTAYELVGGIDERFIGWGGEDVSFARALHVFVGPYERLGAPLWHLWHQPQRRPGGHASAASHALAGRYLDALVAYQQHGDDAPMRALIEERSSDVARVADQPAVHDRQATPRL